MHTIALPQSKPFNWRAPVARGLEALVLLAAFLTNTGVKYILDCWDGTLTNSHTEYLEWGTSTTAALRGDTGNGTAGAEARVAATRTSGSGRGDTNITDDTITWSATIAASGGSYPRTYKEIAVFSALTSGICIAHANTTDATVNQATDNAQYSVSVVLAN